MEGDLRAAVDVGEALEVEDGGWITFGGYMVIIWRFG